MNVGSCGSTSLPAFRGVSVLEFCHSSVRGVVHHCVLVRNSLMEYHTEHLFIAPHLCIILVRFMFRSFAYFFIGLFVFLLLCFKSSLYVVDASPLPDMCFVPGGLWLLGLNNKKKT